MLFSLENKVAVITGGTKGIGLATARRFTEAGASVVIAGTSDGSAVAEEIGGLYVKTDVSQESQVEALMQQAVDHFGGLDVVVNNAGIYVAGKTCLDESSEAYQAQFNTNLMGVVYGIKHGAPRMKNGGSIVNISSNAGPIGFPTSGSYAVSKMGVVSITRTTAIELGPQNIRVNCICPGTTKTAMGMTDNRYLNIASQRGSVGEPDEIAAAIHFLAADDCQYITGETIMVDGGMDIGPSLALLGDVMERA